MSYFAERWAYLKRQLRGLYTDPDQLESEKHLSNKEWNAFGLQPPRPTTGQRLGDKFGGLALFGFIALAGYGATHELNAITLVCAAGAIWWWWRD